jgi:putative transposase
MQPDATSTSQRRELRAVLIRWDKKACNYLGLLKLACALLWFRRYYRLAGLR